MKRSRSLLTVLAPLILSWPLLAHAQADPVRSEPVERIRLNAGDLPSVALSPDLLYRILVAEIAATRGRYDVAGQTLLSVARDTSDPRLARRAFQFSMADRDLTRALHAAQLWALLAPGDPEAVASALALAASNGETAGLSTALQERIAKAENKEQAIAQASVIVGKMPDKYLALEVLEQALGPEMLGLPIAHLALADAAWAAEDPYRALDEALQAQELDPGSEAAAQRVLEYGMKVDPNEALDRTRSFLNRHSSRNLQLMLINRLVTNNDYDGALRQLHDMRDQAPEDFDLLFTEAEVNMRAERYGAARRLLNEYISVQTQRRHYINDRASSAAADASDARLLLVQIAERTKQYDEAIRQLDLIEDPALRFQAQIHKAVLQARHGQLDAALKTIAQLQGEDTRERAVIALTLASIYREAGKLDVAIETLERADKEIPESPELKYDLAMLYERAGNMERFEALMRSVIALDPENANAYNALGYTYADQNRRLDEAEELLERALELDPDNPFILDSIGWYLFRVGDYEAAIEYLERSYEQLPAADVAAHLGEVLWLTDRREEARDIWLEAYEKDPDNDTLQETLKRLRVELP